MKGLVEVTNKMGKRISYCLGILALGLVLIVSESAWAREISYGESDTAEKLIYVNPGEPTEVVFPGFVEGGYYRKNSTVSVEKRDNKLVFVASVGLPQEGEAIIVNLNDKRSYALRVQHSSDTNPRDVSVRVNDNRLPEVSTFEEEVQPRRSRGYAPTSLVSGLMRELVLVAELGKRKGVTGYRRSNMYSGEVVLDDGAMRATIDEIFIGPDHWGYVLSVENKLQTSIRVNPATFRLDGTRAVSASRWELAPQPLTDEQRIANAHQGKVYIVTKAKR